MADATVFINGRGKNRACRRLMHLVQLLLPLNADDGRALPHALFQDVRKELTNRFGGVTAFTRAPAQGVWIDDGDRAVQDDVIVVEVMVDQLDHLWWRDYRHSLEQRFEQKVIVARALGIAML